MSTHFFWRYYSRKFSSAFVAISLATFAGASLVAPLLLSSAWGQSVPVPSNPVAPAPADATTQLRVRNSAYGLTLTDALGRTLYLFEGDTNPDASLCAGACATIWIPMALQAGQAGPLPMAGSIAIQQNLINGFIRSDGLFQVTYNGHPLYYYLGDGGSATTTNGEGINQFGSFWYLVGPGGSALTIPVVQ